MKTVATVIGPFVTGAEGTFLILPIYYISGNSGASKENMLMRLGRKQE